MEEYMKYRWAVHCPNCHKETYLMQNERGFCSHCKEYIEIYPDTIHDDNDFYEWNENS